MLRRSNFGLSMRAGRKSRCSASGRGKRRSHWNRNWLALGVLIACASSARVRAANDSKDLASQNAHDASVVQSTGQADFRIEIQLPKGTAGSEPGLALRYESNLSDGAFGVGWGVELGEIRRSARFGTPVYDDSLDEFALDEFELDGALLVAHPDQGGHPGEYRMLQEGFLRITRIGERWEVEFPDGRSARFGTDQQTRIRVGGDRSPEDDTGAIGRWLLSELEDAHGNITRFSYDRATDVGAAYPKKISYSYRAGSLTPIGGAAMERRVEFALEDRSDGAGGADVIFGYPLGIETRIGKRVSEIQTFVGELAVQRLVLSYAGRADYSTGRSRIAKAQLFGRDCPSPTDPASCKGLPATTFRYTDFESRGSDDAAQWKSFNWAGSSSLHFTEGNSAGQGRDRGVRIADINGDGYPDFVRSRGIEGRSIYPSLPPEAVIVEQEIYINDGTGWGSLDTGWLARLQELRFRAKTITEQRTAGVTCAVTEESGDWPIIFRLEHHFSVTKMNPLVEASLMDLNGDGFADILISFETGAGSVTANTPCVGAPTSWPASQHVRHVWINKGKADPSDPEAGWEQRDDWAQSLPPFQSIYLRSDGGTGVDRPGSALPPGERRGSPSNFNDGVTFAHFFDHGVRMPDLNGDGRPDIVAKREPAMFGGESPVISFAEEVWLSAPDGIGWVRADEYIPPMDIVAEFNYYRDLYELRPKFVNDADAGVRFADVNGDGLADLVKTAPGPPEDAGVFDYVLAGSSLIYGGVWLNTGSGWCGMREGCDARKYRPPTSFTLITSVYRPNEGRAEWGGNKRVVRSSELGFVDLNGDGMLDLLKTDSPDLTGMNAWIHDPSRASIWKQDDRFVPMTVMATTGLWVTSLGDRFIFDNGVRIFDYDGDATVDLLRDRQAVTRQMFISKTAHADLLERIENGQGGVQELEYTSAINKQQRDHALELAAQADASDPAFGEMGSIGLPRWTARSIVSKLTTTDTLAGGGSHSTTMTYAMPRWDPATRSSLGFRAVRSTREGGSASISYFWQKPGRTGKPHHVLTYEGSDLRHKESTIWEVVPGGAAEGSIPGVNIARLSRVEAANYYGSAPNWLAGSTQTTSYSYTDPNSISHGYNFAHRVVISRATGDLIIERFPEPADLPNWIVGKLEKQVLRNAAGELLQQTEYDYLRGLPIRVKRLLKHRYVSSPDRFAETLSVYDDYGNLIKASDPEGRISYFCYDGDASFFEGAGACPDQLGTNSHTVVVGVRDPIGDITRLWGDRIDLARGNLRVVVREYTGDRDLTLVDAFGRATFRLTQPAGKAVTILGTLEYFDDPASPDNSAGRPFVEQRNYFDERSLPDPAASVRTAKYSDGLGREMISVSPTAPGHAYSFGRAVTQRDYAGRPTRETLDLACTDLACSNLATAWDADQVVQTYDVMGRVLTRRTPDGVAAFDYRRRDFQLPAGPGASSTQSFDVVLAKDFNGVLSEQLLDGDRLVVANECKNPLDPARTDLSTVSCTNPDSTFYSYEASGELENIYDATRDYASAAHRLTYSYDTLGRVWLLEDPDGGVTFTDYDRVGNVIKTANLSRGAGEVIYRYDALDRVWQIDPTDEVGGWDLLTLVYDPVTRKRKSVTSSGTYSENWDYDAFGNLEANVRSMFDRTLRTDYRYDLLGRLQSLQSPLAPEEGVSYGYDGAYLARVCGKLAIADCEASPASYFVDGVDYDALGRIDTISEAPGDLKFEYYASADQEPDKAVRQVKRMKLLDAVGSRLSLAYKYNAGGQVIQVDDAHTGDELKATAVYDYDPRGRISYWKDRDALERYFAYDTLGNLVGRDLATAGAASNQFYQTANKPHAISGSNHTGKSYAYDEAGNLTRRGNDHLTYNLLGQVFCVGVNPGSCEGGNFRYDIDGNLLSKMVGTTSEIYVGDQFRLDKNANIAWTYSFAFGKRIVAQKRTGVSLRAAGAPPAWLLPFDRGLAFDLLLISALMGLLALLAAFGVLEAVGERPVSVSFALGLAVLLAVPPHAWAGRRRGGASGGAPTTRTRFLFHDHLGSEVLALDAAGAVLERRVFEPFGEVINFQLDAAASVPASFTGKLHHAELDLYDFGARWYDSESGRFSSVDPIVQTAADPQTHNPYGYVRNNPIGNVDPNGEASFSIGFSIGAGTGLFFGGSSDGRGSFGIQFANAALQEAAMATSLSDASEATNAAPQKESFDSTAKDYGDEPQEMMIAGKGRSTLPTPQYSGFPQQSEGVFEEFRAVVERFNLAEARHENASEIERLRFESTTSGTVRGRTIGSQNVSAFEVLTFKSHPATSISALVRSFVAIEFSAAGKLVPREPVLIGEGGPRISQEIYGPIPIACGSCQQVPLGLPSPIQWQRQWQRQW